MALSCPVALPPHQFAPVRVVRRPRCAPGRPVRASAPLPVSPGRLLPVPCPAHRPAFFASCPPGISPRWAGGDLVSPAATPLCAFALAAERNRCQAGRMSGDDERDGVPLTNLDQPLFGEAEATKRDLVDYLDAVRDQILPVLADRPLSVIRVAARPGAVHAEERAQVHPVVGADGTVWAEASKREVSYALCNDRRTLLWFANQRAVEYHPGLVLAGPRGPSDPPDTRHRPARRRTRSAWRSARPHLVRQALADVGPGRRGQDQRRQGRARVRPAGRRRRRPFEAAAATRAIGARAERLDPGARHHGLHPGRPRGQGVHRLHPGRRRHGRGGRLQPADPAGHAGVVPGPLGGTGPRHARATSPCARRPALLAGERSVGGADARRRSRSAPT